MRQPIPFGKYYLLERINVGGMAEVFKAKATGVEGFERMVAVKRILPSIAEDEEFITMFIDEAKIAVQLTHANVAQIFDLGKVDDSYFIALEFIHGKDQRAIFNRARARGEQIPIPMACYVIMKLCEGLDYAHNKRDAGGQFLNLVHRDVSPQNILVSYEGEVKIIDFGIAKAAGKAGRTQAGILKGKFGYMSPEQVQGFEIDRRSDVFGVGICLYELLTGERLFVGESDFATLEKVRNVDIMPPSTYNRRIPEELEQIVLKALARDRENRHQTAMQLHDELQGFMYGSGNFFGRRDLSMYMHRAFGEEIERESARDQEYASMNMPDHDEVTGLTAFDEIDPVSTVSALNVQPAVAPRPSSGGYAPYPPAPSAPRAASMRGGPAPQSSPYGAAVQPHAPPRPHKATLLGLPTAAAPPVRANTPPGVVPRGYPSGNSRPVVPPLVPRPQSIPPSHSPTGGQPPRLEMDWDDEELSTQIYDRPEEGTPSHASGPVNPLSGSYPPSGPGQGHVAHGYGGAPPGAPSPFMHNTPVSGHVGVSTAEIAWPPSALPQRRPMLAAAVAVVAIIAVIVGALMVFRRPAAGTVHITTVPGDVGVEIDGRPVPGSSPFVANDVAPGVAHEIVVSKQGYRPWSSKFELQSNETMQLPPVTLEALESGFALDSVPSGATVYVDGSELPSKTPVRVSDLGPGDHHIRLEAEGYARWESSLHVTPGTVLDLPTASLIALTPEAAAKNAAVAAAPARSSTTSAPASTSTPVERVRRPRPSRTASITAAAAAPEPEPMAAPAAAPAAPAARAAQPEPEPEPEPEPAAEPAASGEGGNGTLRVQTRPWSKVFVDGRLVGNTPLMNVEVSAGKHTLTFVNEDFNIRKTVKVQIQAGQTLTQVLTLDE